MFMLPAGVSTPPACKAVGNPHGNSALVPLSASAYTRMAPHLQVRSPDPVQLSPRRKRPLAQHMILPTCGRHPSHLLIHRLPVFACAVVARHRSQCPPRPLPCRETHAPRCKPTSPHISQEDGLASTRRCCVRRGCPFEDSRERRKASVPLRTPP